MIQVSLSTLIIIALISIIFGMMVGISLTNSR